MILNKHLLKPVIQVFLFVNILFFVSCSDDTITPAGYQFDPPHYEWTADTVFADISNMWAFDTNNIYYQDPFKLVYYNGTTYQNYNYSSNILAYSIDGYDKYNVFIGGLDRTPSNLYKPKVIKWNGAGFEDFYIGDTAYSSNDILSIKAISQNEIFMGTRKGRVYKYDNGITQSYYFDTNMIIGPFLKDSFNNLYFFGSILYFNFPNPDSSKDFIYRYNNNQWENVYYKLIISNDTSYSVNNIGTDIVGMTRNSLLVFNGSSFNRFLFSEFLLMGSISGFSLSNILCSGTLDGHNLDLFHWNNSKWSKENIKATFDQYIPQGGIFAVNNRFYCALYDFLGRRSLIIKGKPK